MSYYLEIGKTGVLDRFLLKNNKFWVRDYYIRIAAMIYNFLFFNEPEIDYSQSDSSSDGLFLNRAQSLSASSCSS
jgi:hypothetical protein